MFLLKLFLPPPAHLGRSLQSLALRRPGLEKILGDAPLLGEPQIFNCDGKPLLELLSSVHLGRVSCYSARPDFLMLATRTHLLGLHVLDNWTVQRGPHIYDSNPSGGLEGLEMFLNIVLGEQAV